MHNGEKHRREEEHLKRAFQGSLALFRLLLNLFRFLSLHLIPPTSFLYSTSSPCDSSASADVTFWVFFLFCFVLFCFVFFLTGLDRAGSSADISPSPSTPILIAPLPPEMSVLVYRLAYIPLLCLSPHIIPRQVRLLSHRQGVSWFPSLFSSPPPLFLHAIHFQPSASLPLIPSSPIAGPCMKY